MIFCPAGKAVSMVGASTLRVTRPLQGAVVSATGPRALMAAAADHFRVLGAAVEESSGADGEAAAHELELSGMGSVSAGIQWANVLPAGDAADEATVQASTGIMAVHGWRDGAPSGIAVDFVSCCTSVMAVQGMLAILVAQARGGMDHQYVTTAADRTALLTMSRYLGRASSPDED